MELNLVNLLSVLLAAWAAGRIVARFGYPAILGELLVGILLGPALLGWLRADEALKVLADLGVLLMMVYIGMEIDPLDLRKASWPGLLAAVGGFITPFALGYVAVIWFGGSTLAALFVGISVGVTSLATKSRILVDLKLLDTRVAHVLMAGALLSDTATLVIFAGIIGFVELGGIDAAAVSGVAANAAVFFLVAGLLGWKLFPWVGRLLRRVTTGGRTLHFMVIVAMGLGFAELAELGGLHAILGAFVAGLFIRDGVFEHKMMRQVTSVLHDVSIGFLAPIFFVTAGFHVSFQVFQTDLGLLAAVLAVAFVGKILGTALFYVPSGHGWREGITVGAAMNGRGAVEIVVAGIGLEAGIISTEVFSILVFMAISTTATVPLLLKWGVEWLRRHGELERGVQRRKGTIIVGGGPIGRLLAQQLSPPVCIIDVNRSHCAAAERAGLPAICGDALDEDVLRQANAEDVRTLATLTANAEVNVLAAQLGRDLFGIPELQVLLPSSTSTAIEEIVADIGAQRLFDAAADILTWDQWLQLDEAVVHRFTFDGEEADEPADGGPSLASDTTLPLVVERNGERFLFTNREDLEPGDEVVVLYRDTEGEDAPIWHGV